MQIYQQSYLKCRQHEYLDNQTYILADGAFEYIGDIFVTPYRGNDLNLREKQYNVLQRKARSLIEHVFSRMKVLFPVIAEQYQMDKRYVGVIFRTVAVLTNLFCIFEKPLRHF